MGAYEAAQFCILRPPRWVAFLTGVRLERRLIPPYGGRVAPSGTLWLNRLVCIGFAAAVALVVSTGEAAAQPKSGETAAQPKTILFLYSYGLNVQPWAAWSREIQTELNRQSPWPLVIQE
jgi:hypothetical protein